MEKKRENSNIFMQKFFIQFLDELDNSKHFELYLFFSPKSPLLCQNPPKSATFYLKIPNLVILTINHHLDTLKLTWSPYYIYTVQVAPSQFIVAILLEVLLCRMISAFQNCSKFVNWTKNGNWTTLRFR